MQMQHSFQVQPSVIIFIAFSCTIQAKYISCVKNAVEFDFPVTYNRFYRYRKIRLKDESGIRDINWH